MSYENDENPGVLVASNTVYFINVSNMLKNTENFIDFSIVKV